VRTRDGFPNSVQAKCTSSPSRAVRGKPLEREISVLAITAGGPRVPSARTRRTLMAPLSTFPDNQQISAEPSGSNKASTRPEASPSSTCIGLLNVAPASWEKATFTCGVSPAPVNHPTTSAAHQQRSMGHCRVSLVKSRFRPQDHNYKLQLTAACSSFSSLSVMQSRLRIATRLPMPLAVKNNGINSENED
jgi:hypothetical protein